MKQAPDIVIGKDELQALHEICIRNGYIVNRALNYDDTQAVLTLVGFQKLLDSIGYSGIFELSEELVNKKASKGKASDVNN